MYPALKRAFDIFVCILILLLLGWLYLLIALVIKLDSRGPVLFRQKRAGREAALFDILKFRTMRADSPTDVPTHLLDHPEAYITRVGRFLRKTSLDELPQVFNILKGDMSLVGPRPALWNQYDLIELRRKNGADRVPVGMTGWAQINGRDELPIDVKAGYDGWYAQNAGFLLDIRIILRTVTSVLFQRGVREGREETRKPGLGA